jgi:hypothetical protein
MHRVWNISNINKQYFWVHIKVWVYHIFKLPYFPAYSARVIYTKRSEIVKNEHARYTVERFPTNNKVLENTVLCIKHNFQLKLVCSIHSVIKHNTIQIQ